MTKLKDLFYRAAMKRSGKDNVYSYLIDLVRGDSFRRAAAVLDLYGDKIAPEQLNHLFSYIDGGSSQRRDICNFIKSCQNHPHAAAISSSPITSVLHGASEARHYDLVVLLFDLPGAKKIDRRALEGAMIYALPQGDPEIKRIEPRAVDYDFGAGDAAILALFRKQIAANAKEQSGRAAKPEF